jgi:hypothetical protein
MHSAFPLEGKHKTVRCQECHQPAGRNADYKTGKLRSAECHADKDPHGGQFSSPEDRRRECSTCHIATGWSAAGFDHDTTPFPLYDHRDVQCEKCHKD